MKLLSSVRVRLILVVSGTITILLIVLFMAIVALARDTLIRHEIKNVKAITRTFSVFVLDTIISGESLSHEKEFILESYVLDFMKKDSFLKYILIYDTEQKLLATSDFTLYSKDRTDDLQTEIKEIQISYLPRPQEMDTIHCVYPLFTGNKSWGTLIMGFDAKPLMTEIKTLFFMLALVAILLVVVLQVLLFIMISRLTKSLTQLSLAVERIDFNSEGTIGLHESDDEVGILVRAIQQYQQRLQFSKDNILEVQKQAYHAEKLASIGRLASGIAHEVNNPLQGIKNCIQTIKNEPEDSEQTTSYLGLVSEGLDHIETVVRKLLGFARNRSSTSFQVDIVSEINKILMLLDYKISIKNISIVNTLQDDLPSVAGDPAQIQEVFMNLIINSIDAVRDQGEIRLESKLGDGFIKFLITDDGDGIAEEHFDKIFDPFFTTKEQEMGTGLGLSVALGIVESHGGSISVESDPDSATTFTVTLPIGSPDEHPAD